MTTPTPVCIVVGMTTNTAIGTRVRILDALNINYLNTGIVTAVSGSGRVQVRSDVDGITDLFAPHHIAPVNA